MVVSSGKSARSAAVAFVVLRAEGAEQVDQHAAGVAHRVEHLRQVALPRVLDDDRGRRQEVGLDVGVDAFGVDGLHGGAGVVQTFAEHLALDQELDLDPWSEYREEEAPDEFGLADGQAPHRGGSVGDGVDGISVNLRV